MILHGSETSPFVRKCRVIAWENDVPITLQIHSAFAGQGPLPNPVQRVPSFQVKGGPLLVDSRVICDYLNGMRARTLDDRNLEALADGLMDRAVSRTLRLREPEAFHNPEPLARWVEAINSTLDAVEIPENGHTIGAISLVCALGYLDFRHSDLRWRDGREDLANWFETQMSRPSFQQTEPPL